MTDQIVADLEELSGRGAPVPHECNAFRVRVDNERFVLPSQFVTGKEILALVQKDPNDTCLFQHVRAGKPQLIQADQTVDLSEPGIERFRTRNAFQLCIESSIFPWCQRTITTEQIAEIGGWDPALGVIEVDEDQNERTLKPGEVVKLRPGMEYGKKHCWKRG